MHQAVSGSRGQKGPDWVSFSVGTSPQADPLASVSHQRISAPDLSGIEGERVFCSVAPMHIIRLDRAEVLTRNKLGTSSSDETIAGSVV